MYLQGVDGIYDLIWASTGGDVSYGDVPQNEVEMSV